MPLPMPPMGPSAAPGGAPAVPGAAMGAKPPGAPPSAAGPTSTPLSTPQGMAGKAAAARGRISSIVRALQVEWPNFPLESDESRAVESALHALTRTFGKTEDADRGLANADMLNLLAAAGGGAGGAKPAMPMPGGAAPGAPGGAPGAPMGMPG